MFLECKIRVEEKMLTKSRSFGSLCLISCFGGVNKGESKDVPNVLKMVTEIASF